MIHQAQALEPLDTRKICPASALQPRIDLRKGLGRSIRHAMPKPEQELLTHQAASPAALAPS